MPRKLDNLKNLINFDQPDRASPSRKQGIVSLVKNSIILLRRLRKNWTRRDFPSEIGVLRSSGSEIIPSRVVRRTAANGTNDRHLIDQ